jgi:TonB family protein
MLEAMAQSEAEVRATLQRLDDFMAQDRTQFASAMGAGGAAGTAASGSDGAGAAGRPDDWRWTLLEQVSARLRALLDPDALAAQRESARQRLERGDVAGARAQIVEFMQPFMARGEEAGLLMNYIPRRLTANLATTRLRALLRANAVVAPELPRVEQLEALIAAREARDDFMMAADLELSELESLATRAYDGAFAAALNAARAKAPAGLALQDRTARCPVVSDLGPVTDTPKINPTLSTPTSAYYPREALADGLEGKVAVYARVTPEGCVRAAGVLVSTGVEALDAAALRWMLEGAVFSRSKPRDGGEPATAMLNVNFKAGD